MHCACWSSESIGYQSRRVGHRLHRCTRSERTGYFVVVFKVTFFAGFTFCKRVHPRLYLIDLELCHVVMPDLFVFKAHFNTIKLSLAPHLRRLDTIFDLLARLVDVWFLFTGRVSVIINRWSQSFRLLLLALFLLKGLHLGRYIL